MKHTQLFITQFFKPKPKPLITDHFKPQSAVQAQNNRGTLRPYNRKLDYRKTYRYLKKHRCLADASQTRKGYCYLASNNFSEYAVYSTENKWEGQKIIVKEGDCVATATIDEDSALEHIEVNEAVRRNRIGTHLIHFINKHAQQFYVFAGVEHNSRYRLTKEGALLIRACMKRGILKEEQVILNEVPRSPLLAY